MHSFLSRLNLAQRLAAIFGGLCLLVALGLVSIGNLSSRYIIELQQAEYGRQLAEQIAAEAAAVMGTGDLIGLEVTLEQLLASRALKGVSVYDLDGRQIGGAGENRVAGSPLFSAAVTLDGNLAGEVRILLPSSPALLEQRRMAIGLFLLAVLLSLFVAATAARWGQRTASRLREAIEKLQIGRSARPEDTPRGELELLEQRIDNLPLELLKPASGAVPDPASYQTAGLLYIRLNSLASYVETLDETSLLHYTEFLQRTVNSGCVLYRGELSVVRQFGLLVSFSGEHRSGSPVFRAASAAWIIRSLIAALQPRVRLRLSVSMACGVSEAGAPAPGDIYPGLYCQHLIDELAALVAGAPAEILLSEAASRDANIASRGQLEAVDSGRAAQLRDFSEPCIALLQRQQQMLVPQLMQALGALG